MNRGQRRASWLATHRRALRESVSARASELPPAPASVRVNIGELVLHGFPPASRHAIAEATTDQLTSLLTTKGVPAEFRTTDARGFVDAGSFQMEPSARPLAIGSLIARAVYGDTK
jgi:hypothetical protein